MRLNHIGLVVRDIPEFAELFRARGLRDVTKPETDPRTPGEGLIRSSATAAFGKGDPKVMCEWSLS